MARVLKYINTLRENLNSYEIAAGLDNGDIKYPEWLGISVGAGHGEVRVWDTEDPSANWDHNFIVINPVCACIDCESNM